MFNMLVHYCKAVRMSKRKCLSFADKLKVLEEVDSGVKKTDIAVKFGIAPSSVTLIVQSREKIVGKIGEVSSGRKRVRACSYEDVNEAVLRWFQVTRTQNVPIAGNLIKEKALQFAKEFGCDNFHASDGWLQSWKNRNGIVYKTISGESASVNQDDCDVWIENVLKRLLQKYQPKDLFNCDETGLFFKCLPNQTHAFKNDKCFGVKTGKERVTVLIGANMDGTEKLKLLLIGKSKNPRCLKGLKSLGLDYTHNKKAWMTGAIFENWMKGIDRKMKAQKRKIAMFIDNCPAHPVALSKTLTNIELVFFPPNMTSKLQPMDQGIIKNFKVHYRARIIRKIVSAIDENISINKLITLRECITELTKVWSEDVSKKTISNCFSKAGFVTNSEASQWEDVDEIDLASLKRQWSVLQSSGRVDHSFSLEEFIDIDNDVVVAELPSDEEIVDTIKRVEEPEEEDEREDCTTKPSRKQVKEALAVVRAALQYEDDVPDEMFHYLNKCETFIEHKFLFSNSVQKNITDYFPKENK